MFPKSLCFDISRSKLLHSNQKIFNNFLAALMVTHLLLNQLLRVEAVISSHYDEGDQLFTVHRMHKLQQQQKQQQQQEMSPAWPPRTDKLGVPPPPPPIPPTQTPFPSSNIETSSSDSSVYNANPYNSYYYYESNNNNNNNNDGSSASNDFLDNNMLPEHQNPYAFRPHPGFGMPRHSHHHHHDLSTTDRPQNPSTPTYSSKNSYSQIPLPYEEEEEQKRWRNVTSEWLGEPFWQNLAALQIAYNTDPTCMPSTNTHPQSPYLLLNASSPAYRVCEAKSHKRRAVLKSVRLDFCNHWSLAHVFGHNDECILRPSGGSSGHEDYAEIAKDNQNDFEQNAHHDGDDGAGGTEDCRECVQAALAADEAARKAWCYFNYNILGRYDCQTQYSVVWDCDGCREAYKLWICAMIIPFHKREYVIRPCRTFCRWVEQRCPYIAPEEKHHQYGAEPAFRCRDPGIPELFSIYAPEPWCYLPCHLDHSLGPEGACKKVRLQYSQLAEYYNVTNLIRQKQAGVEAAAPSTDFDTDYSAIHQSAGSVEDRHSDD